METFSVFEMVVEFVQAKLGRITFLQIGANDGQHADHLRPFLQRQNWSGVCVEPMRLAFERLSHLYPDHPRVRLVNAAISDKDGFAPFYWVEPSEELPDWVCGVAGFRKSVILSHAKAAPGIERFIREGEVRTITFDSLFREQDLAELDLLQIDTEGFDAEIVRMFDFTRHQPTIVHYEHKHLSIEDDDRCLQILAGGGYRFSRYGGDTLAYRES